MLENRTRRRYDRDEIKKRAEEIVTRYLGPGHDEGGSRLVWTCPACRKEKKYSIRRQGQLAGCLNAACELGGRADVLTFIAYFEGLDARTNFTEVLKRGYEILGLDGATPRTTQPSASHHTTRPPTPQRARRTPEEQQRWLELCRRIYARLMELCPLEDRDRRYLRSRGLTYETIETARFGSISPQRAGYLKTILLEEFGKEDLLQAPGFFEDSSGRLSFTLTGDYLLIPYHDRAGNIATVEGRTWGEIPKHMGKYVSLRGAGNHLYVFPAFASGPERITAFTEGVFGALVAAQNGIVIASIQGCKRYKASFSDLAPEGGEDQPIPELRGVDFARRAIPYIPDADDPPNEDVLKAAPKAAHHLIERQGGTAMLCSLPKGMDLDEWLIGLPKDARHDAFAKLIATATALDRAEEWKGIQRRQEQTPEPALTPASDPVFPDADSAASTANATDPPSGRGGALADARVAEDRHPKSSAGGGSPDHEAEQTTAGGERPEGSPGGKEQTREDRELTAAVYARLLEKSRPLDEHAKALARRGVLERAIEVGRLASLDSGRTVRVTAELKEEFGAEDLIRVPGFERGQSGKISLGLPPHGEYVLLPCFDTRGVLRGLEALEYDPEKEDLSDPEKTLQLDGAGAHLYVFAHHRPAEIEGFCEGPIGAILAAQYDVVLGAVGHFRRYSTKLSTSPGTTQSDTILPELAGVDFGRREILYVPRSGPGEANTRVREAEHARRHLIEKQHGKSRLIFPSPPAPGAHFDGQERQHTYAAPTSMAEWIASIPEHDRQRSLKDLFPESPARSTVPEEGETAQASDNAPTDDGDQTQDVQLQLPSASALALMCLVGLVAATVAYLLIGRLQSFSEYVGVGFGGQPFIEGGPVGSLRKLTGTSPFDFLYAHKLSLSLLPGLVTFSGALYFWHARRRLADLAGDLQFFATGPWSAHQFDGDQRREEQLLGGFVSAQDLLWSVLGGVGSFVLIYLALAIVEKIHAASIASGLASSSYESLFDSSATLALVGGLAAGVYVLLNRTGKHRGRARIAQGRVRS